VSNLTLDEAIIMSPEKSGDILSLNEALDRLTKLDPLKARIVELRHFGGLSVEETAEVLKISEVTVMRHWSLAKSWLRREVRG
jgi:RNA polymerase sigma factor (sigma-70 family)